MSLVISFIYLGLRSADEVPQVIRFLRCLVVLFSLLGMDISDDHVVMVAFYYNLNDHYDDIMKKASLECDSSVQGGTTVNTFGFKSGIYM